MTPAKPNFPLHLVLLALAFAPLAGCGAKASATCKPTGFAMTVVPSDPTSAPNQAAKPPGNQELFIAALGVETGPEPCIFDPLYHPVPAQWTTSDPEDVTISSAQDVTNGLATCVNATKPDATVSATLTAYGFTQTLNTPVVCK